MVKTNLWIFRSSTDCNHNILSTQSFFFSFFINRQYSVVINEWTFTVNVCDVSEYKHLYWNRQQLHWRILCTLEMWSLEQNKALLTWKQLFTVSRFPIISYMITVLMKSWSLTWNFIKQTKRCTGNKDLYYEVQALISIDMIELAQRLNFKPNRNKKSLINCTFSTVTKTLFLKLWMIERKQEK